MAGCLLAVAVQQTLAARLLEMGILAAAAAGRLRLERRALVAKAA